MKMDESAVGDDFFHTAADGRDNEYFVHARDMHSMIFTSYEKEKWKRWKVKGEGKRVKSEGKKKKGEKEKERGGKGRGEGVWGRQTKHARS